MRPRPDFEWTGTFENYARSFVSRNFWRVQAMLGTEEDAVQECALIFHRCNVRYRGKVHQPKHFMALFKTSLVNEFNTYALVDIRHRHDELPAEPVHEESPDEMHHLLAAASDELRQLTLALIDAPAELIHWVFGSAELENYDRAGIARRARRLLGISCQRGTITELYHLLK